MKDTIRRFRQAYGHCEASVFASFLRQKRKGLSKARRIAFSRAYNATKQERWPS